jgi:hypothetical protein
MARGLGGRRESGDRNSGRLDDAEFVTGEILHVDGRQAAPPFGAGPLARADESGKMKRIKLRERSLGSTGPIFLTLEEVVKRYRAQVSEGTLRNWRSMRIGPFSSRSAKPFCIRWRNSIAGIAEI